MLSDSESETDGVHSLTINEHYAKAFQYKKEREELVKLKEKYGSDYSASGSGSSDSEDSEDSEDTDEDSDGEELTPAVDAAILRTLARIRKKDPGIYEGGRNVFEEEQSRTKDRAPNVKTKSKDKSKPLTIRQAALSSALAHTDSRSPTPEPQPLTHTEEQRLLQSETRAAFHGAVDSTQKKEDEEDEDEDDLLVPRSRTRDEIELQEEEYKAFLEREVGESLRELVTVDAVAEAGDRTVQGGEGEDDAEGKKKKKKGKKEREKEKEDMGEVQEEDKKGKKKASKKAKEEADQEFLMNYILNRGWVDRSSRRVPTYNEVVGSSSKHSKSKSSKSKTQDNIDDDEAEDDEGDEAQGGTLTDEDSFDDLADAFETSYNFRFEEPDAALIPSHPRNLDTARRESTTRKDARARKKVRKETEKKVLLEARREEVRRERALAEVVIAEEAEASAEPGGVPHAVDEEIQDEKRSKKQKKREELTRLKTLKAKELRRKLEKVGVEGGLAGVGEEALTHLDLDADWDPSKHDAQMAELYGGGDIGEDGDMEKPTWDDDIDIDDIVPSAKADSKKQKKKEKKKAKKGHDSDNDDAAVDIDDMDADADGGWNGDDGEWDDDDEWKGTEEERKRKVDAYMDEVVNRLGFNDITAHMPTRFHYTKTTPDTYALSPAEVLLATDAELNTYVGLKKMAPYRVDQDGKMKRNWDPTRNQRLKEFRDTLRARVGSKYDGAWSLGPSGDRRHRTTGEAGTDKKKRVGKKERAKLKAAATEEGGGEGDDIREDDHNSQFTNIDGLQKKRKRDSRSDSSHSNAQPTNANLKSSSAEGDAENVGTGHNGDAEDDAPKKKRRRRHKKGSGGGTEEIAVTSWAL
ncbi:hypothetical protein HYDPIDRAFT_110144 [Hydnomerulius pinastri MD-312]|nr:hypothetical protein HYDPIDRAFT_110144 [Hydnomerulius pinastri MD-312]